MDMPTPRAALAAAIVIGSAASGALALTVPFTEHFASGNANWTNSANAPMDFVGAGGPDGSSYTSATFNFVGTNPQSTPAIIRCQSNTGASGGAFFGNWIGGGVTQLSFFIRHDATVSFNVFARFTNSALFPGLAAVEPVPVPGGAWTQVVIPINAGAAYIPEPGATFAGVFSDLARMQIGVLPGQLAGLNATVRFDIDRVSIVPVPGVGSSVVLAGVCMTARRRRRSYLS